MGFIFDFVNKTLQEGNSNNTANKKYKEDIYGLSKEEQKEMKKGHYHPFNFEEDEKEEDDYYYEDD